MLDEEEDINKILKYFSYEHFYVVYCKVQMRSMCTWPLSTSLHAQHLLCGSAEANSKNQCSGR